MCAGDDLDPPHEARFSIEAKDTLAEIISAIVGARYLASIVGGRATWIVEAAGETLAVVAQQWESPKFLVDPTGPVDTDDLSEGSTGLYFRHRGQADPRAVFESLRTGRPLPDRHDRDA